MSRPKRIALVAASHVTSGRPVWNRIRQFLALHSKGWELILVMPRATNAGSTDEVLDGAMTVTVRGFDLFEKLAAAADAAARKMRRVTTPTPELHRQTPNEAWPRRLAHTLSSHLFFPDHRVVWTQLSRGPISRAIENSEAELLVTMGPPFSSHLLGSKLAERLHLAHIVDMPDPWLDNPAVEALPALHRGLHRRLEKMVVTKSALVLAATGVISGRLRERYPEVADRVKDLPVPIPVDSLEAIDHSLAAPPFTVGYFGRLYAGRSLAPLLEGLRGLISRRPEVADTLHLIVAGIGPDDSVVRLAHDAGIDNVTCEPWVPREEAARLMKRCAILVSVQDPLYTYAVASKVLDYISAGRRIISIGPEAGAESAMLRRLGLGETFHPADADRLSEWLTSEYDQWAQGHTSSPNWSEVRPLLRSVVTQRLDSYLKAVVHQRVGPGSNPAGDLDL